MVIPQCILGKDECVYSFVYFVFDEICLCFLYAILSFFTILIIIDSIF